ncbi:hypothetical protein RHSIM_Rhsim09G0006800 [Rhododendron simsii]|uniref:leucine--tRNA ligase n=1 Tax=Rhododendron simsii TaxID=118357 RepID=A0A834LCB0_RHOSS|nr:hypothetical protein RHSIM_Rhsim09G0006800 [Rhododendron simsii]
MHAHPRRRKAPSLGLHRNLPLYHSTTVSPIDLLLPPLAFCQLFRGMEMADEIGGKSFARRDQLLEIESQVQKWWEEGDVFKADSKAEAPKPGEKFFGTFPMPYMNGHLHLGHAFTLSKLEFAAAFHRLRGANVLLPFAFHCTGMPIKAAADKLKREIETFGCPPKFPIVKEEELTPGSKTEGSKDVERKFNGKKSKAAAKSCGDKHQWDIMQLWGESEEEIPKFQVPSHWMNHLPPSAVKDLMAFGLGCDWRRTFITTDRNPFFNSFVQWHMRKLKEKGKMVKDLRYAIYSPLDGQPCADHDRASGEGVTPVEYTLIKMEVVPPFPPKLSALEARRVYLAAVTLRPETMYGQMNSWVFPEGKYGAFEINETEVYIVTDRAALNMAYQGLSRVPEKPTCLLELTGHDLIGLPLRSPLALNEIIYCLPMLSVLTDTGTGIVPSVPSDSPDDYMALHDLKSKPALRAKYGVKDEWVLPFEIIPIINHPDFGDNSAEKICLEMKIKSQNERDKLDEAKKEVYKGGFCLGTMIVGEYAGMKVQEAKSLVKTKLSELGQAVIYCEPEKEVMSRSGNECVVALTDQWCILYGLPEWKKLANECLARMNLYSDDTRLAVEYALERLHAWACSRSYGDGTRIPWDEDFLVDSLSDSTLYMAYYTISHLLQRGDMYGGSDTASIRPEQMTDEVWDYLFCGGLYPESADIPSCLLQEMKQEFDYWYPMDLRVSGKDLIQNHLSFCIYNHTALMAKRHWPRGFRCNGHLMLNSKKMSKSTGNFMMLREAIKKFSASATRFAIADAGDGMDDANFAFETANPAVLKLTKELSWMEGVIAAESSLRSGPPSTYSDHVFSNDINIAVETTKKNYSDSMFREALKTGFYDLQAARDEYRLSCGSEGMSRDLLWRFMDAQTRLIVPVCPHYAEYAWRVILKKNGYAIKAGWPVADAPDMTLKKANTYLQGLIVSIRKQLKKNRSSATGDAKRPTRVAALVFVAEQYDGWENECLETLRSRFSVDKETAEALQHSKIWQRGNSKQNLMRFLNSKTDCLLVGVQALDLKLPFCMAEVVEKNLELMKRRLGLQRLEILSVADVDAVTKAGIQVS